MFTGLCSLYGALRSRPRAVSILPEASLVGPLVAHPEGGANHVRGCPGWASVTSEPSRWQSGQVLPYVRLLKQHLLAAGPDGVRETGLKSAGRARRPSVAGNGTYRDIWPYEYVLNREDSQRKLVDAVYARFRASEGCRPLIRLTRRADPLHHARNQHGRCRSGGARQVCTSPGFGDVAPVSA